MKTKKNLIYKLVIILLIIIVSSVLFSNLFVRLDLTGDNRYTLSKATKNILKNLDNPVTINVYFSKGLPPHIDKIRQDFKEMLEEFTAISRGNVVFDFKNPNEKEEIEREAMQKGIQPILINVREKDQVKQQKAFMGAVIQYAEREEVIPFIKGDAAMEYSLSSSIKKVTVQERKPVGFLQGNGEPSIGAFQQVTKELSILYDVSPVTLTDSTDALSAFPTLVIVNPTDSIPENHLAQLDRFLQRGGKLLIAINRVDGDLSNAQGYENTTGLETWLLEKGISVEDVFAVDAACANVSVLQEMHGMRFQSQVRFPYFPNITNFRNHPVTQGLSSVIFQFASPVSFLGDTTQIQYTTLMTTSEKAGTKPSHTFFDVNYQWSERDFKLKYLPVGVLLESRRDIQPFKMIVFGNGSFAVNGEGPRPQRLAEDNINLFVNAIDYLSDDTGLIALRNKAVSNRPIDQNIEEGKKTFIKYLNFSLPLLLIIGYGIIRTQRRKKLRMKRMQKGYVM